MARFIEVEVWSGSEWKPAIIQAEAFELIANAPPFHSRPACIAAIYAGGGDNRLEHLKMTWEEAVWAFGASPSQFYKEPT